MKPLSSRSVAFTLFSALIFYSATTALGQGPLALGDSNADLSFTPLAPCRIFDSRSGRGEMTPSELRSFLIAGDAMRTGPIGETFSDQGGNASGCGVPTTATAVMINLVATGATGPGNLRAFAWDAMPVTPSASTLNFGNVSGLAALANGVAVPICDSTTTTCDWDLIIGAFVSSVDVVGDVVGYFSEISGPQIPIAYGHVNADGSIASGSGNFTVNLVAMTNTYIITISGEVYDNSSYVTLVSPIVGMQLGVPISTTDGMGNLAVSVITITLSGPVAIPGEFTFVVYKP